jgi:hypothetical protein
VEVGVLRAEGIGLPIIRTQVSLWLAPAVGWQITLPLRGGSALAINGDVALPATRQTFQLDGADAFKAWAVVPSLRIGGLLNVL